MMAKIFHNMKKIKVITIYVPKFKKEIKEIKAIKAT